MFVLQYVQGPVRVRASRNVYLYFDTNKNRQNKDEPERERIKNGLIVIYNTIIGKLFKDNKSYNNLDERPVSFSSISSCYLHMIKFLQ